MRGEFMKKTAMMNLAILCFACLVSCNQKSSASRDPAIDRVSPGKATPQSTATSPATSENQQSAQESMHRTETLQGVNESKLLCGVSPGIKLFDMAQGRGVRVATLNLYGAFSSTVDSLKSRIDLHAQNIINANADTIGIQESEDMSPAGMSVEMLARRLSELSGQTWYWCFFRSNPHSPLESDTNAGGGGPLSMAMAAVDGNTKKLSQSSWFMGDSIVSRFPFASAGARRMARRTLSEYLLCQTEQCRQWAIGESRVVMRVELIAKGQSLHFFNSHFYTNITSDSAKSQTRQAQEVGTYVNDVLAKRFAATVLACDCNSPPEGVVRTEILKLGFLDAWATLNPTVPGFTGGQQLDAKSKTATSRIDYLYLKGLAPTSAGLMPEASAATPVAGTIVWPSDHLGVVAEIKN